MINLSDNPDAVLALEHGVFVLVNSIEFKFEVAAFENQDGTRNVFLTTTDSRIDEYNKALCGYSHSNCNDCKHLTETCPTGRYGDYITHLRSPSGQAAMLRYELAELIRTNDYEIH